MHVQGDDDGDEDKGSLTLVHKTPFFRPFAYNVCFFYFHSCIDCHFVCLTIAFMHSPGIVAVDANNFSYSFILFLPALSSHLYKRIYTMQSIEERKEHKIHCIKRRENKWQTLVRCVCDRHIIGICEHAKHAGNW